jgi:hypothetical protein
VQIIEVEAERIIEEKSNEKAKSKLQKSQEWLAVESEKLEIQKQKRQEQEKRWRLACQQTKNLMGATLFVFLWFSLGASWGILAGINLPAGVVCWSRSSPLGAVCSFLRLRNPKLVIEENRRLGTCKKNARSKICRHVRGN